MGEAKRRKLAQAQGRVGSTASIVDVAARWIHSEFLVRHGLRGACHYSSFALRAYLERRHQIAVEAVVGFIRPPGADQAWSLHTWVEHQGKMTDIALHYPNPPSKPGHLVIDGHLVRKGAVAYQYNRNPDDGAPRAMDLDMPGQARRIDEYQLMSSLAAGTIEDLEAYLGGGPAELHAQLQACLTDLDTYLGQRATPASTAS